MSGCVGDIEKSVTSGLQWNTCGMAAGIPGLQIQCQCRIQLVMPALGLSACVHGLDE